MSKITPESLGYSAEKAAGMSHNPENTPSMGMPAKPPKAEGTNGTDSWAPTKPPAPSRKP